MKVSKYMTQKLITVAPHQSVKDAFLVMRQHRVRHLPVVEGDRLVGILTESDFVRLMAEGN